MKEITERVYPLPDFNVGLLNSGPVTVLFPEYPCGSGKIADYNRSAALSHIAKMLIEPQYYLSQKEKEVRGFQIIRRKYPADVKTPSQKAEFLYRQDISYRIKAVELPENLDDIEQLELPMLLNEIRIPEQNEKYCSVDGVVFSKDLKTLIKFPGYKDLDSYSVPEGTENIREGAFDNSIIGELVLPSTIKVLKNGMFHNVSIGSLVCRDGLEKIESEAITDCMISEMSLPGTVRKIEDHAFKGTAGLHRFECSSDEISVGVGIFSNGYFSNVDWWPWSVIPKATFLNSEISYIDVPDGVEIIDDCAFAGCRRVKRVRVPGSVRYLGPRTFDEAPGFCADFEMPEQLFKYIFRVPALSKVNGRERQEILGSDNHFEDEKEVIEFQLLSLKNYIESSRIKVFAGKRKITDLISLYTKIASDLSSGE